MNTEYPAPSLFIAGAWRTASDVATIPAADIGDAIEAGMIGVNLGELTGPETPFGGVNESGHGSEGGTACLDVYLLDKYIAQD